ncbi:right-handed parallel beta-helix repeat-containing protein [Acinetobacter sp. VNH17]|uniref:Right-handed parallel beta-helix repeat-containing protein n=1 Tax=Acinetobacter thutiue TaxID=2998078 RepID=A0ABT7WJU1_9GAMM|nr:right-handed parallel beta-helix repeat-containing protein [Acinetobacter thutiue]MCY6410855.1 right-handed parallel beta-helix repeat-containing protein [Acinetobacter thutiue]MDN0012957.1 right-handed parallel beta-helix repeat-containing protein [Acinetobacter thutiue]
MKLISLRLSTLAVGLAISSMAAAETYIVDRYQDDSEKGSFRWAIEQANSKPTETSEIQVQAVGKAPYVIQVKSPLPEIKAPVKIIGTQWAKTGEFIAIDGSSYIKGTGVEACPGAVEGQFGTNVRTTTLPGIVLRDIHGVTIQGLEIRHFCIGILMNRASNNLIQHNRIMHNYGGAGVMLTGDDGKGNPTATTTNNNKVIDNYFQDNGDGLELTRGAAFNLVANNQFISTAANPEPSQGIEILWGNDNAVVGNKFENYSDGLQINWGKRNYIAYNELTNNSNGFNLTGDGNIFDSNKVHGNRVGIAIRSEKDANARITLTKNQIWNNGKDIKRCEAGGSCVPNQRLGAIIFDIPGLEHAHFVGSRGHGVKIDPANLQKTCQQPNEQGCNQQPNQSIQAPKLSLSKGQVVVEVKGQPNQRYQVEFFGNSSANSGEAEFYLGSSVAVTNAQGIATVAWKPTTKAASLTANVTDQFGATSELSSAVKLK